MNSRKLINRGVVIVLGVIVSITAYYVKWAGEDSLAVNYTEKKKLPIYSVEAEGKKVALSFDAAWGEERVLEVAQSIHKNLLNVQGMHKIDTL